jgi:pilus assembly protein Flp/PilA
LKAGAPAGRAAAAGNRRELDLMRTSFIRFASDESGVTAIEYALIAGLVALGIVASVGLIGTTISTKFYGPLSGGFS